MLLERYHFDINEVGWSKYFLGDKAYNTCLFAPQIALLIASLIKLQYVFNLAEAEQAREAEQEMIWGMHVTGRSAVHTSSRCRVLGIHAKSLLNRRIEPPAYSQACAGFGSMLHSLQGCAGGSRASFQVCTRYRCHRRCLSAASR